jgi:HPt (histidine-containing phosphotransfer) domain-containing protein
MPFWAEAEGNAMAAENALDYEAALGHVAGDADLLRELAGVFLAEEPGMRAAVEAALRRRDPAGLKRAAHTLKGSAGTFEARAVHEAAWSLELMGADNNLQGADEAWARLSAALDGLCAALRELGKGQPG